MVFRIPGTCAVSVCGFLLLVLLAPGEGGGGLVGVLITQRLLLTMEGSGK